ncbi:MAG: hypothetical protein RH982_09435 [Parvibaculum sp.]
MRHGLILCALLGAALLQSCAPPPPRQASQAPQPALSDNLAAVIADIESAATRIGNGERAAARSLPHDIEVLTRAIEGGQTDAEGILMLRYYRGQARQILVSLGQMLRLPTDRQMAEAAISDFTAVAGAASGDASTEELKKNAMYLAGYVATSGLDDAARGMGYFQRCAAQKHAGCQNVVASAKVGGSSGMAKDLNGAAALHLEAYGTRLDYGCSGPSSAFGLAQMTHFTSVKIEDRSSLDWLRRAYRLADQAKVRSGGVDACGGDYMSIYEYLIRLEKREKKPELLDRSLGDISIEEAPDIIRKMVGYLRDESPESEYRAEVIGTHDTFSRCEYAFVGLWKAAISNQMTAARAYRDIILKDRGNSTCAENLTYAGRFFS